MKTLIQLLAASILAFASLPGFSADSVSFSFAGCTDSMNRPVASKADPGLPQLVDVQLKEGNRVIVYNPSMMPQLLPETRAFFYAHACAITKLGQPIDRERSDEQIRRADCWAYDTLVRSKILQADTANEALETDLSLSPEVWPLVPGKVRTLDLAACGGRPAQRGALKLDQSNASPGWTSCSLACGNKLFACGRSNNCQSAFDQCVAACPGK